MNTGASPRGWPPRPCPRCLTFFSMSLLRQALVLRGGRGVGAELLAAVPRGPVARTGISLPVIDDGGHLARSSASRNCENGIGFGARLERRRERPDQDPDDDEDHPEQQALEGRVQPRPPNRLAFKSITPCEGPVTRKSSATASPTTHTILSWPSTTSGIESRSWRGILRSTNSPAVSLPGRPYRPASAGRRAPEPDRQRQRQPPGLHRHYQFDAGPRLRVRVSRSGAANRKRQSG